MVPFPGNGCKITSPVPYVLFTRIGNSNSLFLPTYHVYLEQMLRDTYGFLPPLSSTPPLSLNETTIPPPLSLLVTICELMPKIACIEEAKCLEAEDVLHPRMGTTSLSTHNFW
jgi:hypothetical protein